MSKTGPVEPTNCDKPIKEELEDDDYDASKNAILKEIKQEDGPVSELEKGVNYSAKYPNGHINEAVEYSLMGNREQEQFEENQRIAETENERDYGSDEEENVSNGRKTVQNTKAKPTKSKSEVKKVQKQSEEKKEKKKTATTKVSFEVAEKKRIGRPPKKFENDEPSPPSRKTAKVEGKPKPQRKPFAKKSDSKAIEIVKRGRPPTKTGDSDKKTKTVKNSKTPNPTGAQGKLPAKESDNKSIESSAEVPRKRGRPSSKTDNSGDKTGTGEEKKVSKSPSPNGEKKAFTCPECAKPSKNGTCFCKGCDQWIHLKCAGIRNTEYTKEFRCRDCTKNTGGQGKAVTKKSDSNPAESSMEVPKKRGRPSFKTEVPDKRSKPVETSKSPSPNKEIKMSPCPKCAKPSKNGTCLCKKTTAAQEAPLTTKSDTKPIEQCVEVSRKRGRPSSKTEVPDKKAKTVEASNTPSPNKEKKVFTCPECEKPSKNGTCFCKGCNQWIHLKCAGIRNTEYTEKFRCRNCSK